MQGLCKELFHPAKFCLHCSYAYEAKAAFLLENGKHESGAWVALQPVSFSQQLARVSPEGPSLSNGKHESGAWVALQPVSFSQQQ